MKPDLVLWKTATCVSAASCALAFFALLSVEPVQHLAVQFGRLNLVAELLLLGLGGAFVYGAVLIGGLSIAGVKLRRPAPAIAKSSAPPYGW
jgi:putative peptidoglycan lipid II flippase